MDAETKRRIDNARDALVGKVPDPKGQVEQITIALTYKFMDDMDLHAVRLGGKRRFFAGDFEEYAWSKLMDPAIGAQQMLQRYSRGIERMSDNPGAAPLFRTIFANAFLPYNDPSTLQQFLRIINEFEYDNSEALGDAYEYLTSFLGSQGDAGQFRTPRHIIDFIVDVVDPQLGETVLDPACGTGGFLISAYEHIKGANSDAGGTTTLTPGQMAKLADSLTGYDIDPGMVRIALLNMYLHGMVDPHIHEYDTLTSEAHWNDYADVIIANPPFMTPRGGIRPHSKFGVQSRRSEVLFVNYMAEHLMSNGRAGIIVPEGIMDITWNGHKQLRKMLVNDYLTVVVSLPGGVFNPYTDWKTCILLFDRALARKSDSIAFFKVNNDGYDLGAQRRPIDDNDLPQVLADLKEYLRRVRAGKTTDNWTPSTGRVVRRDRIAEDGEYNLSGERYRVRTARPSKWPMVRLGDVAEVESGNPAPQEPRFFADGTLPFVRTSDVGAVHLSDHFTTTVDQINRAAIEELRLRLFPIGTILFPKSGASTYLNHRVVLGTPAYVASHLACIVVDEARALPQFLFRMLTRVDSRDLTSGQSYASLRLSQIADIRIPSPPLNVQQEFLEEIEGCQRVIDGARMVVRNWRPQIDVDPEWPNIEVDELVRIVRPPTKIPKTQFAKSGEFPIIDQSQARIAGFTNDPTALVSTNEPLIVFGDHTCVVKLQRQPFAQGADGIKILRASPQVDPEYLYAALKSFPLPHNGYRRHFALLKAHLVPLPPRDIQREIAQRCIAEEEAVMANIELIASMEERVRDVVARVWG